MSNFLGGAFQYVAIGEALPDKEVHRDIGANQSEVCVRRGDHAGDRYEQFSRRSFFMTPLVFLTDFGTDDGAVSAMYGVAYGVDPELAVAHANVVRLGEAALVDGHRHAVQGIDIDQRFPNKKGLTVM